MIFRLTSPNFIFICASCVLFSSVSSRKHHLILENDIRRYFSVTTFGFFNNGRLEVNLNYLDFSSTDDANDNAFGFTFTRTVSDGITPYMESHQNRCLLLDDALENDGNIDMVSFLLNMKNNELVVNCSRLLTSMEITGYSLESSTTTVPSSPNTAEAKVEPKVESKIEPKSEPKTETKAESKAENNVRRKRDSSNEENPLEHPSADVDSDDKGGVNSKKEVKADGVKGEDTKTSTKPLEVANKVPKKAICPSIRVPFHKEVDKQSVKISNLKFIVSMNRPESEGLFSLYFHNCAGNGKNPAPVNLSIYIIEQNGENFLSAGEILLPRLYFILSVVFFFTGCIWVHVLKKKREETFKIHYLMSVLVFLKSLSLLFHGINFHIIAKDGYPMEAWAVLYYITHLLKGALLFITIVLIGTGWAFIKHILSDKDKKIFMIVIPLQVLANVAKIIMEESEEGDSQHYTWREVFILVDLLCCGAILFPVVWSIRHLQEASQTDGKAAINLEKLKLFRHFYVMIVCYIYFTRIIVYLLKITVPFQYEWLDELFRETATLIFFILTAYNFRPTASNPYFRLSQDEEIEIDEVITQTGFTEGVTKTVRSRESQGLGDENGTITTKRESSHEYD